MPTQKEIAEHLDLDQSAVSRLLSDLQIDWHIASMDAIRWAYVRKLRAVAAAHTSDDGKHDLVAERVMTERVAREKLQLELAEKKGQLVNVAQLEPALVQMVVAFRTEVLTLMDRIKTDLDALHGINIDPQLLADLSHDALDQLARYDPERAGPGAPAGQESGAAAAHEHHRVGPAAPAHEPQEHGPTGSLQP